MGQRIGHHLEDGRLNVRGQVSQTIHHRLPDGAYKTHLRANLQGVNRDAHVGTNQLVSLLSCVGTFEHNRERLSGCV